MPHLIFQTKFPLHEQTAEMSFFGSIERETMEALQEGTLAALHNSALQQPCQIPPIGIWHPSPYSGHVVHFEINIPGNWQWRQTLQNMLHVVWLDIFERMGWSHVSMWNASSSATSRLLAASSDSSHEPALQLPEKKYVSNVSRPAQHGGAGGGAGAAAAGGRGGEGEQSAAGAAAGAAAAAAIAADGPASNGDEPDAFLGECTNFLLFKSSAEAPAARRLMLAANPCNPCSPASGPCFGSAHVPHILGAAGGAGGAGAGRNDGRNQETLRGGERDSAPPVPQRVTPPPSWVKQSWKGEELKDKLQGDRGGGRSRSGGGEGNRNCNGNSVAGRGNGDRNGEEGRGERSSTETNKKSKRDMQDDTGPPPPPERDPSPHP